MPRITSKTLPPVLLVSLWLVSGCAERPVAVPSYPPSVDLVVQDKPRLDPSALDSDKALNEHDAAIESWGEAGWLQVARLCRWAQGVGMKGLDCPKR
jgi:hypothetical protein